MSCHHIQTVSEVHSTTYPGVPGVQRPQRENDHSFQSIGIV